MTAAELEARRGEDWRELDELLHRAGAKPERLGADGVLRLGALYRATAADLAYARRRAPGDPLVGRLETRVARGRAAVYGRARGRTSPRELLWTQSWAAIVERPRLVWLAAALLLLPAVAACLWALAAPEQAIGLVPGMFEGAVNPVGDTGMTQAETAVFSSEVLTNNIRVAAMAFALGLTGGIGTAGVLIFNGLTLGAIAGVASANGRTWDFVEFVAGHGIVELSAIVAAGAAGLRLGWAILHGGDGPRGPRIVAEGRRSALVWLALVPTLVVAGLVEGFLTRSGFGLVPGLVLGTALGLAFWALAIWRGRVARRATAALPASP